MGNYNGWTSVNITKFGQCSSVRRPNFSVLKKYAVNICFEVVDHVKVDLYRFDYLLQQGLVTQPDFIKIDVQGFEYEVIEGFGNSIDSCIGIELEAHFYQIYEDQKLLGDIVTLLQTKGFYLRAVVPQYSFDDDLVEVNAYFTKSATDLSEESRIKLRFIESVLGLKTHENGKKLAEMFGSSGLRVKTV